MKKVKVDLTKAQSPEAPKAKKFPWKRFFLLTGIFFAVLGLGFVYQTTFGTLDKISQGRLSWFNQIKSLNKEEPLLGEEKDRINILLLGIGGENHPGGTLTDTIIVASLKPSTKQVALLSIPRDLAVKYYNDENPQYWEGLKINHAYERGGPELAEEKISEVTGLDMHYYVLVDFAGFRKVIDDLGGLNIYVENSFTDYQYPDYNYGYQTVSFKKGWEKMTGERALQFARSRHGNNGEGSDFARAARQQKILEALKEKIFSLQTLLNPLKVAAMMSDLGEHIQTNAEIWEMIRFAYLTKEINKENIINKVVEAGPDGLLNAEIADQTGAYVLTPKAGDYDFSEVQKLAKNVFEQTTIVREEAKIIVQNGTRKSGLAAQMAERLKTLELNVISVGNALDQNTKTTVIYDFSGGKNPQTIATIKKELGNNVATIIPTNIQNSLTESPDILIILGADRLNQSNTTTSYAT